MDNLVQKELLHNNPEIILKKEKTVLIDGGRLESEMWPFVRHTVDLCLPNGSALFTGNIIGVNLRVYSGISKLLRLYMVEERQTSDFYINVSDLFKFNAHFIIDGETTKTLII